MCKAPSPGPPQNLLPVAEATTSPPSAQIWSWFRTCSVILQVSCQVSILICDRGKRPDTFSGVLPGVGRMWIKLFVCPEPECKGTSVHFCQLCGLSQAVSFH